MKFFSKYRKTLDSLKFILLQTQINKNLMVSKNKSIYLWIFAVIFTISSAIYQRLTGPTHPKKATVSIKGESYTFKLIRSHGGEGDAEIELDLPKNLTGTVEYRAYKSKKSWTSIPMISKGEKAVAELPHQPPAGKLEYIIKLYDGMDVYQLNEDPVVIRFKGRVPLYILIPHIMFMFTAMLMSTRTGIEALFKGHRTLKFANITIISLFIGGLILGPLVQLMAFGDLWTGWPFGGDWTDNKTIFAFTFWLIAILSLRKNKNARLWPIIAFLVLFGMYMIPHSMGGSELNTETGKIETGLKK